MCPRLLRTHVPQRGHLRGVTQHLARRAPVPPRPGPWELKRPPRQATCEPPQVAAARHWQCPTLGHRGNDCDFEAVCPMETLPPNRGDTGRFAPQFPEAIPSERYPTAEWPNAALLGHSAQCHGRKAQRPLGVFKSGSASRGAHFWMAAGGTPRYWPREPSARGPRQAPRLRPRGNILFARGGSRHTSTSRPSEASAFAPSALRGMKTRRWVRVAPTC